MTRISLVVIGLVLGAAPSRAQSIDIGKREFQARCASCHGDDGTGGARGFNIVNIRQPRAASKDAVRELIRRGIPNAGMPAFSLSDGELESITAFVMSLRPTDPASPGSAANATAAPAGSGATGVVIPFADIAKPRPARGRPITAT